MMSGLLSAGAVVAATNKFRSEVYMRGHSEQYRKCHPRTALNDSFLQYRGKEESNRHFTCTYTGCLSAICKSKLAINGLFLVVFLLFWGYFDF